MKYDILAELRKSAPGYVSGESLGKKFGISRTAIWKQVKDLKRQGYIIESSSKKGYRFISAPDILNEAEISYGLDTQFIGKRILYFEQLDSTNEQAKKEASGKGSDGTVVIADSQLSGKGRMGRKWFSPHGKGICMSVILKPSLAPQDMQLITIAASVAVQHAIHKLTGFEAKIKWPNDIVIEGMKVCGILTEMSSDMDRINYVVVGIGLNVGHDITDFPEEIRDTAVSLKEYAQQQGAAKTHFKRSELIKAILCEFERLYRSICENEALLVVNEWKSHSATLGNEVKFQIRGREFSGIASDITPEGRLVVACSDGVARQVISGDVTIRTPSGRYV